MKHTLTDLSQLSRAMFKAAPEAVEAKPVPPKPKSQDEGEEVLAYFSRKSVAKPAQKAPESLPAAENMSARAEMLERNLVSLRAEMLASEQERASLSTALAAAQCEVERLKGECGRLQGELRKASEKTVVVAEANPPPQTTPATRPLKGVLASPAAFAEAFPGELREMILSSLSDARDTAHQSGRERRAAVLDAVLAANKLSGELERRRAELKQTMKDAGYYTDPHALESLGFKLISGKTHWKLEYAGIRMPLAKTPSDYRANLNMATDMANRCF